VAVAVVGWVAVAVAVVGWVAVLGGRDPAVGAVRAVNARAQLTGVERARRVSVAAGECRQRAGAGLHGLDANRVHMPGRFASSS